MTSLLDRFLMLFLLYAFYPVSFSLAFCSLFVLLHRLVLPFHLSQIQNSLVYLDRHILLHTVLIKNNDFRIVLLTKVSKTFFGGNFILHHVTVPLIGELKKLMTLPLFYLKEIVLLPLIHFQDLSIHLQFGEASYLAQSLGRLLVLQLILVLLVVVYKYPEKGLNFGIRMMNDSLCKAHWIMLNEALNGVHPRLFEASHL